MRKFGWLLLLLVLPTFLGCAYAMGSPVTGFIYTGVKAPQAKSDTPLENPLGAKHGTGECKSVLGWFGWGDCSVDTAAHSAGIKKVTHVDMKAMSVLGIYAKYTVVVYGD